MLNTVNKIVALIIMNRIAPHMESTLRNERAGSRANRSCLDQSNTLRPIIEQSNEFCSPLYLLFIDFEKAFDNINRSAVWQSLSRRGIPGSIVRIIKALYVNPMCTVLHNGRESEEFTVRTGVRQGCVLSPLLFIVTLDEVMKEAESTTHGIQ